jgi:hypothetical protein
MATSLLIHPNVFSQVTEGQILTWRKQTYANLHKRILYNKEDILLLETSPVMSINKIRDSIKDRIIMYKSTGQLSITTESVFVMVDSCVLGIHALPTILSNLRKNNQLEKKNIILVVSHINMTENNYKIEYRNKYPCINFKRLMYNMMFLEGNEKFKMKNIVILKTDIIFDNKILVGEEQEFLRLYGSWQSKDRNEINDNAQLEMLIQLNNMFSKKCIIVTRDKDLINKANIASRSIKGLYTYYYA